MSCVHSSSIGPGKTFTTRMPAWRISGPQCLGKRQGRGLRSTECALRWQRRERINREISTHAVDGTELSAAARPHRRAEALRKSHHAEIVDLHFGARGLGTRSIGNAAAAMEFGIVDEDIDLCANRPRDPEPSDCRSDPAVRRSRSADFVMELKPGGGFQGSATPTQIVSAPASASALHNACPVALLASVTRTFLSFGSEVISRSILSSARLGVSVAGSAISVACPALSRCARTRTRCGSLRPGNRRAATSGP